jgi:hypothetical protein
MVMRRGIMTLGGNGPHLGNIGGEMNKILMLISYLLAALTICYHVYVAGGPILDYHKLYLTVMVLGEASWVIYLAGLYLSGRSSGRLILPIIFAFPILIYASCYSDHMTNLIWPNLLSVVGALILIYRAR